jgi:hypothetical protein
MITMKIYAALRITDLTGKIALPLCILNALEVNAVLRLYFESIATIQTMVLFRGNAAHELASDLLGHG